MKTKKKTKKERKKKEKYLLFGLSTSTGLRHGDSIIGDLGLINRGDPDNTYLNNNAVIEICLEK